MTQKYVSTRQKQTLRHREQTCGCQREGRGKGRTWEQGVGRCQLLHLEWINDTPLQSSCLENPMDGGAWQATVHGVAESQTRLSDFTSLSLYSTGNYIQSFGINHNGKEYKNNVYMCRTLFPLQKKLECSL